MLALAGIAAFSADAEMIRRRPIQQYHCSLCAGLFPQGKRTDEGYVAFHVGAEIPEGVGIVQPAWNQRCANASAAGALFEARCLAQA
jgi:hypothetical protein